jgi:hypothetical protein
VLSAPENHSGGVAAKKVEFIIIYRRSFRERGNEEWRNMLERLQQEINLTDGDDQVDLEIREGR